MSKDDELKSEFRPPDDEMIEFMLTVSDDLGELSSDSRLTEAERALLEVSSRSIKVLLAMSISGHALFIAEGRRLDAIANVARSLHDILFLIEPSALESVENINALKEYSEWEDSAGTDEIELQRKNFRNLFWTD